MYDMLKEKGAEHIRIFGGGGGTILPSEIEELHNYGIARLYSPDDGRSMGLQGMINDLMEKSDFPVGENLNGEFKKIDAKDHGAIARVISAAENFPEQNKEVLDIIRAKAKESSTPILGITGTGGAGKSSTVDEFVRRFLMDFEDKTIGIISVDPSKRKTGGALLGDRIRMNAINNDRVYMRSLATRSSNMSLSAYIEDVLSILKVATFDLIILETSGIGQSDTAITDFSDMSMYVMTPEYGAASQLEKIDMLDFADIIALNKYDKRGALDALRDVKKQFKRNHQLWETDDEDIPVYGTIASQFNDPGMNQLYSAVISLIDEKTKVNFESKFSAENEMSEKIFIIPPKRVRYLSEISENNRKYDEWVDAQALIASDLYKLKGAKDLGIEGTNERVEELELKFDKNNQIILKTKSLSHLDIPRVSLPKYKDWGDILRWSLQENVPGSFPFTAGVFPFKRKGEDPTRMFAGEGGPERTNKRFHYLSLGMPAARLSTAFDSVTLYGEDPDLRPDIYGKIGNSGVSICCLDDAKKLYSGFDLSKASTSVSMTINGPAAIITGFFMNAAIDQQCEKYIKENGLESEVQTKIKKIFKDKGSPQPQYYGELPEGNDGLGIMLLGVTGDQVLDADIYEKIKKDTLAKVRGTVQADILKEDQAQNTCIFSTEFSLRIMGDMQAYFIENAIRNFYSVSISGYHIAEAVM